MSKQEVFYAASWIWGGHFLLDYWRIQTHTEARINTSSPKTQGTARGTISELQEHKVPLEQLQERWIRLEQVLIPFGILEQERNGEEAAEKDDGEEEA